MPLNYLIKKKCKYCNKVFQAYVYNIRKGFGKYCSTSCSNKANNLGFKRGHPSFWDDNSRRKISLALMGRIVSEETRQKISHATKGREISYEHRDKIRKALKGIRPKSWRPFPKGHTINLGKSFLKKGQHIKCPECGETFYVIKSQLERRKYCSKKCLFSAFVWRKSISKRQIGRRLTEITKEKLSLAFRGEKSSLWMGGKGLDSKNLRLRPEYAQWRRKVLRRDDYMCTHCGSIDKLNVDHITPVVENENLIFEVSNGRTLCWSCHNKVTIVWRKSRIYKRNNHGR